MTRAWSALEAPVQRSSVGAVSRPHDAHEHEADRAAAVVARGGSVTGWSFAAVPTSARAPVQRQEKPKANDEKYKEALTKAGEAALETPVGKALKAKVLADPVVKAVTDGITSPGGLAAIGVGVGALAVAGQPLPVQPPTIKLDRITPGLSADITWKGPVAAPTQVGLVLTYKEQGPKQGPQKSATEKQREENAKLAAADAAFRRGLRFAPGTKEAEEQRADEEAIQRYVTSRIGALPGFGSPLIPLKVGPPRQPEENKPEDAPVQRATAAARDPATAGYDTSVVDTALATPGSALDAPTRGYMESRFGHDFSAVRVHADPTSARTALALDADAYTTGRHIVFAPGRYDPTSAHGRRLLAHELTHVVQQGTAPRALGAMTPAAPLREA